MFLYLNVNAWLHGKRFKDETFYFCSRSSKIFLLKSMSSYLSPPRSIVVQCVHASLEWYGGQGSIHRLLPHQPEGGPDGGDGVGRVDGCGLGGGARAARVAAWKQRWNWKSIIDNFCCNSRTFPLVFLVGWLYCNLIGEKNQMDRVDI